MEEDKSIYHEKQRLQFCLLHALNNLLQEKGSFTRVELDAIADKLVLDDPNRDRWTPLSLVWKPHHNALTGNYDVNVLIAALEGRSYRVAWHDCRNGASSINLAEETLLGIMLNIPVRKLAGLWRGRHWVTLRRVSGVWYNLDSDLAKPKKFQHEKEVTEFLDCVISQEVSPDGHGEGAYRKFLPKMRSSVVELGELGKLMVAMLPDDLAFTIFTPSEEAFERFVNLRANDSLVDDKMNDTFAILSRAMGFCTVPRLVPSEAIPLLKEISFDSVSGYRLHAWKASNGTLFVNNVRSERVDMRKGEIIVHIMSGVIMDPEFEQSFQADEGD